MGYEFVELNTAVVVRVDLGHVPDDIAYFGGAVLMEDFPDEVAQLVQRNFLVLACSVAVEHLKELQPQLLFQILRVVLHFNCIISVRGVCP